MKALIGKIVFWVGAAGAAFAGFWAGKAYHFAEQVQLLRELREVATIIFGIMGAWLAIVYPDELKRKLRATEMLGVDASRLRNFRRVMRCLLWSAGIVAAVLAMQFAAPVVRQFEWATQGAEWLRRFAFAAGCFLAFGQVSLLVVMFVPINDADAGVRAVQEMQRSHAEGPQGIIGTRPTI